MDCCHCQAVDRYFDANHAAQNLERYRRHGPVRTTQMLIEALEQQGVSGRTLLDIGGGIGAIQHELLKAGARHAWSVEASSASLVAAREEAGRQGLAGQVAYY